MSQHRIVIQRLSDGKPLPNVEYRHDPLVCEQYGAVCDYGSVGPRRTGYNGIDTVALLGSTVNHYFIANYSGVELVANGTKEFGGSYNYSVLFEF